MSENPSVSRSTWKWSVCGLLLLATMLNYMDRQTLAQTIKKISGELGLNNQQYGQLEMGFGLAFAAGALVTGWLVDRWSVRWMYPAVLLGWSLAGVATAYCEEIGGFLARTLGLDSAWLGDHPEAGKAYLGLMACRVTLGFFEAGHWPCALVTTQRILSRQERSLGNSILQSGASLGAIITPLIVQGMVTGQPGSWRSPFVVIGLVGMVWIVPWFILIRSKDLARPKVDPATLDTVQVSPATGFGRRFMVLVLIVTSINFTWQFFRAWLPKFLGDYHEYSDSTVNYFTSAYYIATDVGCLGVGFLVRFLAGRGMDVHHARLATFSLCTLMTGLAVVVAQLGQGPLLLGLLLVMGAGALGLFPNYYAFTQELSMRHQGKLTGLLGAITWVTSSPLQLGVGWWIDTYKSYAVPFMVAGLAPVVGLVALLLFWDRAKPQAAGETNL